MFPFPVQALWDKDSPLLQLPHFTKELAARCTAAEVASVFDVIDLEDGQRRELLGMSEQQLADVANVCNRCAGVWVCGSGWMCAGKGLAGARVSGHERAAACRCANVCNRCAGAWVCGCGWVHKCRRGDIRD